MFKLILLGNMLTDGIFAALTEIAPGVERVQIIPKAIKISQNCFVSFFLPTGSS